jgi:hypothetical protein
MVLKIKQELTTNSYIVEYVLRKYLIFKERHIFVCRDSNYIAYLYMPTKHNEKTPINVYPSSHPNPHATWTDCIRHNISAIQSNNLPILYLGPY